jgi:putative oxidoreductase
MNAATELMTSANKPLTKYFELGGRVLLGQLFLLSGLYKLGSYFTVASMMQGAGVPSGLLPLVIATEIGGGLAVILGWKTRPGAFLLAGFTLIAGLLFHSNFADPIQQQMFIKNVTIAGGLLVLMARGAGPLSIDARRARRC